jgi:anionic cell wall polymer biosynthesis LytR-Cps2A-Psr (LCP) family protein
MKWKKVVLLLRKLCIAVIVLSFLGFGPLKSFFHSVQKIEGKSTNGIPIVQSIKNSTQIFSQNKKVENFLITEVSSEKTSPKVSMLLKYDAEKNKLLVGSVKIPSDSKDSSINALKKEAEKNYHVVVDHSFTFKPSGMAQIIDLLAPNGLTFKFGSKDPQLKTIKKIMNGKETIAFIEQLNATTNNQDELIAVFLALKEEIEKQQSPENWFSKAPSIMHEAYASVHTDLGKEQFVALGIKALLNPIAKIEPISSSDANIKAGTVDAPLKHIAPPVFN